MEPFSVRDFIVEKINRLFIYTDKQNWEKLQHDVFAEKVMFDMSSMGGKTGEMTSREICEMWKEGFEGLDGVNHLAGNYLIDIENTEVYVFAYATATHYKKSATKGTTRKFIGTYNIHLKKQEIGWRIIGFAYNLKFSEGNPDLT